MNIISEQMTGIVLYDTLLFNQGEEVIIDSIYYYNEEALECMIRYGNKREKVSVEVVGVTGYGEVNYYQM